MSKPSKPDPRSDAELVAAANLGDSSAFAALYHRHRDWVMRHAHRWTGNHDDALDVLQETFRYLLGKLPDLMLSAKMTTFLYPVVKNIAHRLRERRRLVLVPEMVLDARAAPETCNRELLEDDLRSIMEALPAEQREIVLLRFLDDMTLAEIAELLQIPTGTVKSRLHYAIAALRDDARTRRYFLDD